MERLRQTLNAPASMPFAVADLEATNAILKEIEAGKQHSMRN